MAKVALALTKVTCADGTTDYNVGLNPNTNADDKVQAFVDAFKSVGNTASSTCHGLPLKLILAMWGGESGWATAAKIIKIKIGQIINKTSSKIQFEKIEKGKIVGRNLKVERSMRLALQIFL